MFKKFERWTPALEHQLNGILGTERDKRLLIDEVNTGKAIAFSFEDELTLIIKDEMPEAFLICAKGRNLGEAWKLLKPALQAQGFQFLRYHTKHKGLARLGGEQQHFIGTDSNGCSIYKVNL